MYFSNAVMMRLKAKKRKIIRTHPESSKVPLDVRREEKELEGLLSLQEWLRVFMETCSGLWQLGPPYYRRILHFIYCAVTLNKFAGELEKVCVCECMCPDGEKTTKRVCADNSTD